MPKKILYFKIGLNSNTNLRVFEQLKRNFSEYEVVEVEVMDLVNKRWYKFINFFYFIWEYGLDFLLFHKSRWTMGEWKRVTSYMFRKMNYEIRKFSFGYDVLFTFQTGSVFDASLPHIPHFVYTDSTVLANQYYPGINKKQIFKSKAWMKLEPLVYRNATLNFLFSTNQQKSLIEQYGIDFNKTMCVYAGSNSLFDESQIVGKAYDKKIILFVGVNWERKGGVVLAKAFKRVLKKVPDAKLLIVGVTQKIVTHFSPEIDLDSCIIKGRVPVEEVEQYYREASVFCMPTRIEPFGIVFIEAMLRKLPLVASDIGAIPDFLHHGVNGFMFHPDDVESFSTALIELLNNPEKCKIMGAQGHEIAKKNYTWDSTGKLFKEHISKYI